MEGQFQTERGAPLRIGGFPDPAAGETRYALEIPGGPEHPGLRPPRRRGRWASTLPAARTGPTSRVVHVAFQVMVGCGMAMVAVALWARVGGLAAAAVPDGDRFLWASSLASPLGMLAVEAGWVVTEVGRQPWIMQGSETEREGRHVTPVERLVPELGGFIVGSTLPSPQIHRAEWGPERTWATTMLSSPPSRAPLVADLAPVLLRAHGRRPDFGAGVFEPLCRGPRAATKARAHSRAIGRYWRRKRHVWADILACSIFPSLAAPEGASPRLLEATLQRASHVPGCSSRDRAARERVGLHFPVVDPGASGAGRRRRAIYGARSRRDPGHDVGTILSGSTTAFAPFPLSVGALTLALFTYLAATYLAVEAPREPRPSASHFRRAGMRGGRGPRPRGPRSTSSVAAEAMTALHERRARGSGPASALLVALAGSPPSGAERDVRASPGGSSSARSSSSAGRSSSIPYLVPASGLTLGEKNAPAPHGTLAFARRRARGLGSSFPVAPYLYRVFKDTTAF